MNQEHDSQHRLILQSLARQAMLERGLLPDFSAEAQQELERIQSPTPVEGAPARDLRDRLWCSIDNDDSLDLDQLTVADRVTAKGILILVAIADVDGLVKKGCAIDDHARENTTSVYTPAEIFPMLPTKLSTNLTSLNFNGDRLAVVIEMVVADDGSIQASDVYRAQVRNHAKLAYNSVAAWFEGRAPVPAAVASVIGLAENLRLQDRAAQRLKNYRHIHGALSLQTIESRPIFAGDQITNLEEEEKNRAKDIIEDFMIAANGITSRFLSAKGFPSIRRVVRTPKRWDRIVEIAARYGYGLPVEPDSKALEDFLVKEKAADPLRFPDLSISVIKLIGRGEYTAQKPGEDSPGHFGLAVKDYTHSTAPNRRFTDLITQRLLKAVFAGSPVPYALDELETLAQHCTEEEDTANKVERQMQKSAAALLLEDRCGETFDGIITGASPKGTWVRLTGMPVEGKLVHGFDGVDVGDRVHVQLESVDVAKGFIDFKRSSSTRH